jgi:Mg2+/Co2+ transporter CorB
VSTVLLATLGGILVLLVLSAFFSGSETAVTAASRARIHHMARVGSRRARIVEGLQERRDRLIGAILLGNNLVNILASALATSLLIRLVGDAGVAYATLVMTLLVLIFAEVLPKTYAITHAERMALTVAPVLRAVVWVMAPLSNAVHWMVRGILLLFGVRLPREFFAYTSEEELRGAIALHHGPGEEVAEERAMLRSILDLDDLEVGEVMTHRRNLETINIEAPTAEIVEQAIKSPYSRLPLWREEPDNIVGVLHSKDLLRALREHEGKIEGFSVTDLAQKPWFVPEATSLLDQLKAFQTRREHMAVVVDEYGALLGLVTLEDILEEIVGDIADEHDVAFPGVRPQPDGSYSVDGSVTIRDLNRELDWNLPDEEASTVAGLVLHEARMIPKVGQVFEFHGCRFEILRRQRNQITTLRVTPLSARRPEQSAVG